MRSFAPWEDAPHLALAVSGGADSLALAHLAQRWAQSQGGRTTALMVDHGLRPEAAAELDLAEAQLTPLGIDCHRLTLQLSPGCTQEVARDARYEALTGWCRTHGVLHLLTGHHADDQSETLMLRWLAGSGPAGMAGMSGVIHLPHVRLLRPLLQIDKQRLCDHLSHIGWRWSEDPSNHHPRYARSRVRTLLAALDEAQQSRLQACVAALGRWRTAHEAQLNRLLARWVRLWPEGTAHLAGKALNHPLAPYMLAQLFCVIGNRAHPPRRDELLRVQETLRQGGILTLHGCIAEPYQNGILLCREYRAVQTLVTPADARRLQWDRFILEMHPQDVAPLHLAALGEEGLRQLKVQGIALPPHLPRRAAMTLPALWHLDRLICAPHIQSQAPKNETLLSCRLNPAKSLGKTPFFAMNGDLIKEPVI